MLDRDPPSFPQPSSHVLSVWGRAPLAGAAEGARAGTDGKLRGRGGRGKGDGETGQGTARPVQGPLGGYMSYLYNF